MLLLEAGPTCHAHQDPGPDSPWRRSRAIGARKQDAEGNGGRRRPSFRRLPKETVGRRTWPSPLSWEWTSFQSWSHKTKVSPGCEKISSERCLGKVQAPWPERPPRAKAKKPPSQRATYHRRNAVHPHWKAQSDSVERKRKDIPFLQLWCLSAGFPGFLSSPAKTQPSIKIYKLHPLPGTIPPGLSSPPQVDSLKRDGNRIVSGQRARPPPQPGLGVLLLHGPSFYVEVGCPGYPAATPASCRLTGSPRCFECPSHPDHPIP